MVWLKEKKAGDIGVSAWLFDAKPGHFDPTLAGSAKFLPIWALSMNPSHKENAR